MVFQAFMLGCPSDRSGGRRERCRPRAVHGQAVDQDVVRSADGVGEVDGVVVPVVVAGAPWPGSFRWSERDVVRRGEAGIAAEARWRRSVASPLAKMKPSHVWSWAPSANVRPPKPVAPPPSNVTPPRVSARTVTGLGSAGEPGADPQRVRALAAGRAHAVDAVGDDDVVEGVIRQRWSAGPGLR